MEIRLHLIFFFFQVLGGCLSIIHFWRRGLQLLFADLVFITFYGFHIIFPLQVVFHLKIHLCKGLGKFSRSKAFGPSSFIGRVVSFVATRTWQGQNDAPIRRGWGPSSSKGKTDLKSPKDTMLEGSGTKNRLRDGRISPIVGSQVGFGVKVDIGSIAEGN